MDRFFRSALEGVLSDGESVPGPISATSPHTRFGTVQSRRLSVTGWAATTGRLTAVALLDQVRKASTYRGLGMAMWNLLGRDDAASLRAYNPAVDAFSDDGVSVRAPWGARLWRDEAILRAIDLVRRDPGTLRAVIPVFSHEDVGTESRDVPCLVSIGLRVSSQGRLDVNVWMRALSAYGVLPYDHAFLALLAQALAGAVGVPAGSLMYWVGDLHVSAAEIEQSRSVLSSPPPSLEPLPLALRPSPFDAAAEELGLLEQRLRDAIRAGSLATVADVGELTGGATTWARDLVGRAALEFLAEAEHPEGPDSQRRRAEFVLDAGAVLV